MLSWQHANIGGCAGFSKAQARRRLDVRGRLGETVFAVGPLRTSRSGLLDLVGPAGKQRSRKLIARDSLKIQHQSAPALLSAENERLVDTLSLPGQMQRAEQAFRPICAFQYCSWVAFCRNHGHALPRLYCALVFRKAPASGRRAPLSPRRRHRKQLRGCGCFNADQLAAVAPAPL